MPADSALTSELPERSQRCLNCGQPAGPRFCGHCGQSIDDHRTSLAGMMRELIEEVLSVDGRAIRTVRALPRPGRLTRLYLDGKRAPFLTPFRVYLLASLALFSSLLALNPPNAAQINLYIAGELVTEQPAVARGTSIRIMEPDSNMARWMIARRSENFARLRAMPPQEVIDRVSSGLRTVLPIALILFLPVLATALKLLYIRSHVLYVDHLIFGVHFQSALFLALALAWGVTRLAGLAFLWSLLIYVAVWLGMLTAYLPLALRRMYGESRGVTAAKTVVLIVAYMMLLQPVLGLAVLLVIFRI